MYINDNYVNIDDSLMIIKEPAKHSSLKTQKVEDADNETRCCTPGYFSLNQIQSSKKSFEYRIKPMKTAKSCDKIKNVRNGLMENLF